MVLYLVMVMIVSVFGEVIDDSDVPNINANWEEPSQYITNSGIINQANPETNTWYNRLWSALINNQAFSFDDSKVEKTTLSTYNCRTTGVIGNTYEIKRGGLSYDNKPLKAGAKCNVGDYIYFKIQEYPSELSPLTRTGRFTDDIFVKLWYKNSADNLMYYNAQSYSAEGMFDKWAVNRVLGTYWCYTCGAKSECSVASDCSKQPPSNNNQYFCNGNLRYQFKYEKVCSNGNCGFNQKNVLVETCTEGCAEGTCVVPSDILGCTDSSASNYNSNANKMDNSCIYPSGDDKVVTPEPTPIIPPIKPEQPTFLEQLFDVNYYGGYTYAVIGLIFLLVVVLIVTTPKQKRSRK